MKDLLKALDIPYQNIALYERALTHASYAHEHQIENNERLEFLGDAVIELLMSEYLFHNDTQATEGKMTKKRAQSVCEDALVIYASRLNLKDHLKIGRAEATKGANNAMIADALEALFGAVYLDLGYTFTKQLFDRVVVNHLDEAMKVNLDFKSRLQELIQSGDKRNISYHIINEEGPSHNKKFTAVVKLDGHIILGTGHGRSKQEAEKNAAKEALKKGTYDS